MEAITSRPLLLAAVGKAVSHANPTTLYLTPWHGRADLLRYISDRIAPVIGTPKPAVGLPATGLLPDLGSVHSSRHAVDAADGRWAPEDK